MRGRGLLPIVMLTSLMAAGALPGRAEVLATHGRRLHASGNWLVVTAADLDRVALFDVSGAQPRKVAEMGGEQGSAPGLLRGPHGALLRPPHELVVADSLNHRIQGFDLAALREGWRPALRRAAGRGGSGPGEYDAPMSGVVESAALPGLLFVADTRNARVQVLDASWHPVRVVGRRGDGPGELQRPSAIALDPAGRLLYVADEERRQVFAFDAATGDLRLSFAGCPEEPLSSPAGLAVTPQGDVLVSDRVRRRLLRLRPVPGADGGALALRCVSAFGRYGAGPGEWQYPQAVAADGRGRIYVCDQLDGRCHMYTAEGALVTAFAAEWEAAGRVPPVRPVAAGPRGGALCSATGAYGIRLQSLPDPVPLGDTFSLDVAVSEGCAHGAPPATDVALRVAGHMPEHRHGMVSEPRVLPQGAGVFRVQGLRLHMAGIWELYFDVVRGAVLERAQMDLRLQ